MKSTTIRDVEKLIAKVEPIRRQMLADNIRILRNLNRATKKAKP